MCGEQVVVMTTVSGGSSCRGPLSCGPSRVECGDTSAPSGTLATPLTPAVKYLYTYKSGISFNSFNETTGTPLKRTPEFYFYRQHVIFVLEVLMVFQVPE